MNRFAPAALALLLAGAATAADAGTPAPDARTAAVASITTARIVRDVPYGTDPRQRFDIYAPRDARNAPVIFLIHGGGWQTGDKASADVIDNKVARWLPRGVIVVSTNYRLLPDADPQTQARDVARAIAVAQREVVRAGGNPWRFVLMGHSAGAHLAALLTASPGMVRAAGARPWLGTVLLDSAAVDVVQIMQHPHLPLYDAAFGTDPRYWLATSPLQALRQRPAPVLAVCSSLRSESCPANQAFIDKVRVLGGRGRLLPQPLSHGAINARLGENSAYTRSVEMFLGTLGFWRTAATP